MDTNKKNFDVDSDTEASNMEMMAHNVTANQDLFLPISYVKCYNTFNVLVTEDNYLATIQHFVLDCPENTVLIFEGQPRKHLSLKFRKELNHFVCQWKEHDNEMMLHYHKSYVIEEDKCFFTPHYFYAALINALFWKYPTCIIKNPATCNIIKVYAYELDLDDIAIICNCALHSGFLYGFLSSKPIVSELVVKDMYSMLSLDEDAVIHRTMENKDRSPSIKDFCKSHGLKLSGKCGGRGSLGRDVLRDVLWSYKRSF